MASSVTAALAILLALAVAVQFAHGADLVCEELPAEVCAFAVSSGGARCVLERTPEGAPRCQTSAVRAQLSGWLESDACVRACGADRAALGLPVVGEAAAEDRRLVRALCSAACRDGCPNVFDLYATLAAGEGVSLPAFCQAQMDAAVSANRRMMVGVAPIGAPVGAPMAAPVEAAVAAPVAAPAPCE